MAGPEGKGIFAPFPVTKTLVFLRLAGNGQTTYTAIARHRSEESRKTHEDMGFFDGWGTVAEQLEAYAQSLAK